MNKPIVTKIVAVVSILAGLGVLALELRRFLSGASVEIWLWGLIALMAIVLGVWELVAGKREAP